MSLEFRHIAHSYGDSPALHDISFTAPAGEITCLLGSSGCGKSTLLNLAAGLLAVQTGSIFVGDSLIADPSSSPPPEKRPIGLMFQDGALFPHMTVAQNVRFGLAESSGASVESWLDHVGLDGLGGRYPHQLSGGQQQRAALARAMAAEPDVLLMDEPFASVDIVLRRSLRRDCRAVLRARGATVVMVTHDPEEALDIGDRIAVMEGGRITQFGTPQELYEAPASARVGTIFHGTQILTGELAGELLTTPFGAWSVASLANAAPGDGPRELLLRTGQFAVERDKSAGLTLRDIRHQGAVSQLVFANDAAAELVIEHAGSESLELGQRYAVTPATGSVLAFTP